MNFFFRSKRTTTPVPSDNPSTSTILTSPTLSSSPPSSPSSSPPSLLSFTSTYIPDRVVSQMVEEKEEEEIKDLELNLALREREIDFEMKKRTMLIARRKKVEEKEQELIESFIIDKRCPVKLTRASKGRKSELMICGNEAKIQLVVGEKKERMICSSCLFIARRRYLRLQIQDEALTKETKEVIKRKNDSEDKQDDSNDFDDNSSKRKRVSVDGDMPNYYELV